MQDFSFRVDPHHTGLRLTTIISLFASGAIGLVVVMPEILNYLGIDGGARSLALVAGSIVLGVSAGKLVESILLRVWPSGKLLSYEKETLVLSKHNIQECAIDLNQPVDILAWYFEIPKDRAMVPKGWFCVACHLTQEDNSMTLYAFTPPEEVRTRTQWQSFVELRASKDNPQQSALNTAEMHRWSFGAELNRMDFYAILDSIAEKLDNWKEG